MRAHGFFPSFFPRSVRLGPALAAACLLVSCIGGTGTDTENGNSPWDDVSGTVARVVDPDGRPLAGVELSLHTPGFRGDSGAAQKLLQDGDTVLRSDSLGYAFFTLAQPGKFVVEGRKDGASLFFDTLAVSDVQALSVYTFRTRPATLVKGRVQLESGLRLIAGTVFVRGTARFARLDSAGSFDLGLLPVDVGRLAIGLSYRTGVREARLVEQQPDTSKAAGLLDTAKPVYTCREVSVDSAARVAARDAGSDLAVNGASGAPAFASMDSAKLDTARLAAVERSCDSLPGGTVITVRSKTAGIAGAPTRPDTSTVSLIAVGSAGGYSKPLADSRTPEASVLVPLNGCVALPGPETTTYQVDLIPTAAGSDLFVGDVADKCQH